jgi:hypothetical protein
MESTRFDQKPKIGDEVLFDFITTDQNGCPSDPYKVDKIVIYFIERSFEQLNENEYQDRIYDNEKLVKTVEAEKKACDYPTEQNIFEAKRLRVDLESGANIQPFYYKDATPVHTIGTPTFPAWFSTDIGNAMIEKVDTDTEGNQVYGNFRFVWKSSGFREGDYFVCYVWTPVIAADQISSHQKLYMSGDTTTTTTIPSHVTKPEKYETLMERYTPEVFKIRMSTMDRTPDVMDKMNKSVADGFTVLEDYANQMIDLFDANVLSEKFLPFLSSLFHLKFKSNDPYRWRRQIKRAVPLFKKKGTISGLKESLDQAGIKFLKYTRLWQVISNHTWQDAFTYDGIQVTWNLTRVALPLDLENFELLIRKYDSDIWEDLTSDYVFFGYDDGVSTMTWIGESLSVTPVSLDVGDTIRVVYKYRDVQTVNDQNIENYIRTLSLADSRDERSQQYPVKNWNVRVIEEDDPLFDLVIPTKSPFHDDVVFGKVRTEFPYSENIYNMEEYNGSIRNSKSPCDIDKDFLDPCFSSLSSKYNIDIEIENLSNDRVMEANEILTESMPFHAVLHVMNIYGGINEIVEPPVESLDMLVKYFGNDFVISGSSQMWFNRAVKKGATGFSVLRDELASSELVHSGSGTAYNDEIMLFSGDVNFERVGMLKDGTSILKILTGSLAGEYNVVDPTKNTVVISSMTEPIDVVNSTFSARLAINQKAFSFRLSNPISAAVGTCDIYQDNLFRFSDSSKEFSNFKSLREVSNSMAVASWKIKIPSYSATPYEIIDIMPDGSIILEDNGSLPSSSATGLTYTAYDQYENELFTSYEGLLSVSSRARTKVNNANLIDVRNVFMVGDYQKISGSEYKLSGFINGEDDQFYLENYSGGDMIGYTLEMYRRVVDGEIGYLSYKGIKLQSSGNLESSLGVSNGLNNLISTPLEDDSFKENFLVEMEGDLYFMSEIDGNNPSGQTTIALQGLENYWKTLSGGGTAVSFNIYKYTKTVDVTIPGQQFDLPEATFQRIDRRGNEVVGYVTENVTPMLPMLSLSSGGEAVSETTSQSESVQMSIEYKNGKKEKGEL